MAGLDVVLGRPDVQVFLRAGAGRRDLRFRPFPGAADIRRDAASLSDVVRDAVHRQVCFGMADAVPEHLVLQGLMAVDAGKLAVRERSRLAGVVPEHLDKAALLPARPASDAAAPWAALLDAAAALALYKPGAVQFAA
jgi:hypothetical protein